MRNFLEQNIKFLVLSYMILGGFFLFAIETPPDEAGSHLLLKWVLGLAIPIGLFMLYCAYAYLRADKNRVSLWFGTFFLYIMIAGLSTGYVLAANALWAPDHPVIYEGTILNKSHGSTRRREYWDVTIVNQPGGEQLTFDVGYLNYDKYQIGDHFQRTMSTGRLGFAYRWHLHFR